MAKLLLNYDALNESCIEILNNSISKLDVAINIFESLNIPYDYNKRHDIINIKNSVISKKRELVNIRNWIVNSNNDFTNAINEFCIRADKLPSSNFGIRKGL